MSLLFPALHTESGRTALRFGERALSYRRLAAAAGETAARIGDAGRVAVWATPTLETAVGVVAALLTGVPAVPVNPRSGERELAHIVADSAPSAVLAQEGAELPEALAGIPRTDVVATGEEDAAAWATAPEPNAESAALIVYTSGTTGPPKGVVLSRRAIASTLDALEDAWQWTEDDVVVHALPLFHVHGLILGVLGPLRRGGCLHHLGRFSTEGVTSALAGGGTMLFGVPTMYHRLAEALDSEPDLVRALSGARLLVSGSAPLPLADHHRITDATGRHVVERYGMTETLMNTSVRADGEPRPGTVGVPLRDVGLRLVDDAGERIPTGDGDGTEDVVGEVQVRGPNLFTEYLNRPDATAGAFDGGWFRTGDMATQDADGHVRLVGRKATDLIKSGGYKIGAGEIENVLLSHDAVAEAAVTAAPDPDLGEHVVAWIVAADPARPPQPEELAEFVAKQLAPHKRPRTVHFVEALPRNDMGKVLKRELTHPEGERQPEPGAAGETARRAQ
ncbi:acyl-CoA synthetase [Streptomyces winkii]|uniref:acyl-CoA synthetase n=1 Tax=Streptomyces winkii TaxID=3051178 RepID=UPI0028D44F39|nr:acyl-CoA synthetase [Streptomyces sp. DSM 40971]